MNETGVSLSALDAIDGYNRGARLSGAEADAFNVASTALQIIAGSRHGRELLDLMSDTLGKEVTLETLSQAEVVVTQHASSRRKMSEESAATAEQIRVDGLPDQSTS